MKLYTAILCDQESIYSSVDIQVFVFDTEELQLAFANNFINECKSRSYYQSKGSNLSFITEKNRNFYLELKEVELNNAEIQ